MLLFSQTADRIGATTKKLEKSAILSEYFRSVSLDESAVAAVFFSGRPFPVWEETTLQVGGTLLWRIVAELSGRSEAELTAAYRQHGDLGDVAEAVLPQNPEPHRSRGVHSPAEIQEAFREIASTRRPAMKAALVRELLNIVSPLEAKYIVKIITGDLRIGLKESLVEEAVAKAFADQHSATTLKAVQRANMLLGDIGETLKLAAVGRLADAKMRLFHPLGFMLASPAESAEDALTYFQNASIEDKYDGIRAQAHCSGEDVRFFSRTRDEITESFPELPDALTGLPSDAILDGEIVAWDYAEESEDAGETQSYVVRRAEDSSYVVGRPSSTKATQAESENLTKADSGDASHAVPDTDSNSRSDPNSAEGPAPEERTSLAQRGSAGKGESPNPSPGGTTETGIQDVPNRYGRALSFSALQQRLGRKKVSEKLMREVPVAYLVFDVLYANGELLIDLPLRERAKILDYLLARRSPIHHRGTGARRRITNLSSQTLFEFSAAANSQEPTAESALPTTDDQRPTGLLPTTYDLRRTTNLPPTAFIRTPVFQASSPDELNLLFDAAQARGNEGLMIKDPESPYTPGRRGKSWLKLKRELATLDVVVTAVEYGHGRRIGVLSDYTFAVRDGERLLNVGKAYSGLTDAEISEMTKWFLDHTIEDQGFRRTVEPKIVLEVAFNNVMMSDRHESGYALRFPRIVRLRPDKLPEEADTLERVKEIYNRQS